VCRSTVLSLSVFCLKKGLRVDQQASNDYLRSL
jgi:hypothetical protein